MNEPLPPRAWGEANHTYLMAELAALRLLLRPDAGEDERRARAEELTDARRDMPGIGALDQVAAGFGLTPFERSVLLLTAGTEFVAAVRDELAAASGSPEPSFGSALALLPDAHWSALTPGAPLRRWRLVSMRDSTSPTRSPLTIDERVLHHLAGVGGLDPELVDAAAAASPPSDGLPPTLRHPAGLVVQAWNERCTVLLHGPQPPNLAVVAAAAAAARGQRLLVLPGEALLVTAAERERTLRLMEREAVLAGHAWAVDLAHVSAPEAERITRLLPGLDAPAALLAGEDQVIAHAALTSVHIPRLHLADRRELLRSALRRAGAATEGADTAAGVFDLTVPDAEAAARGTADGLPLWQVCRELTRPALAGLAKVLVPRATWDDLVLPEVQAEQLRALVASVRHRTTVLDDWGFAGRTLHGLGTTALFAGPSGTGKTLAAEVVAGDLGLDLVHIDLSGVMSKYIGETEKNLRRLFAHAEDSSAVLLFDEADALFGKRAEVRDGRDRYANVEVGYLLQRLETFRGLAILTTNAPASLDPAFTRRLGVVVDFPHPDPAQRAALWRGAFPDRAPVDGLDPAWLAGTDLTGGGIASVARAAAYLAAAQGGPVTPEHVRTATRWELAKVGRTPLGQERHDVRHGRSG
ncbi:AAA family ATPase [Streptomyces sp. Caat 7-52]|uniref:ATP-binding protein n=1 Tax=Streptomyces sp. Caat 7-52 TaxID=2949637 RepID=UPI00203539E2|nr:AAA family ATPase [Streptomyces sp. Caat 7-52]